MTSSAGALNIIRSSAAAAVASLVSTAIAHGASVLAFFVASGADTASLGQLNSFFLPSSLILFLLLGIGAALDGFRHWYAALMVSLAASLIASLLGSTISVLSGGSPIDEPAFLYIVGTLVGPKLVFIIAAMLAVVTAGRRTWRAIAGGRLDVPRGRDGKVALVRLPAANLADGQLTHLARSPIDSERADDQWDEYVSALMDNGWDIVEVPVAAEAPDSVFVEDVVVVFGDTAVITSPGAQSRREETAAVEDTVRELGLRIERIQLPGTLDGGDVLKVGDTVYVGRSSRTNAEGIRQLREILARLGYTTVAVPVTKALHLKSTVTALPDGTVIGYPPVVDDPSLFARFLAVPEESGAAVVVLDDTSVLLASSAPASARLIAELGYRVVTVDISEFEKLEGCVTCLSVRVR